MRYTTLLSLLAFLMLGLLLNAPLSAQHLKPATSYEYTPEAGDLDYEETKVTTADGAQLNVWYLPCINKSTSNTILFSHNGDGNMGEQENLDLVYRLVSNGYNVVMYDYRGFGASSGFEYSAGLYIAPQMVKDMKAMIAHVAKAHTGTFYLLGQGVGATLSLGVGIHQDEIRKIVADHPILTLDDYKQRADESGVDLKIPPFGYPKNNEPSYALESEDKSEVLRGIKLIVSEGDILVSPDDMDQLASKDKRVTVWKVESTDNSKNFEKNKDAYVQQVIGFMND